MIDTINEVISKLIILNTDEKVKEHLLNKLKDIKSKSSLEMILDIYPFIEKYSDSDNRVNVIDSICKDDTLVKKLVIPMDNK